MNGKHNLLIGLIILMALVLTSACQPREATVGAPPPTELPAVTSPPAQTSNLENPALKAKLEAGEVIRIMPLGGSVVEGICDRTSQCKLEKEIESPMGGGGVAACSFTRNDENPEALGFRGFLRDKLAAEGVDMTYVGSVEVVPGLAHEGHVHFRIDDIDYCVQNAGWLEEANPDMILLLIGGSEVQDAEAPEAMIESLGTLLGHIYEKIPATTEVIVAQYTRMRQGMYPMNVPSNTLANDILSEYNAGIPQLIEKLRSEGKHVSTVDMWDTILSDDELSEGGSVPRSVVGERMAQVWLERIMKILGRPVQVSASPTLQPTSTQAPPPPPRFYVDNPLRIMPLGDSRIEGYCDRPISCNYPEDFCFPVEDSSADCCRTNWNSANPRQKGFREFLRNKLVAAGVNINYVGSVEVIPGLAHEGHYAFSIPDLDYCIQNANWLEQAKPDMILLETGGLDLIFGSSPEEVIEKLKGLLTRIYQELPENTEVLVAQIAPSREGIHVNLDPAQPLFNEPISEYNAKIPAVVEEFRAVGKHVSLVDLRNTIQSTDEYDESGFQRNVFASERVAQAWFEKIMEIIEQQD